MKYIIIILLTGLISCQNTIQNSGAQMKILAVLTDQQKAWNEGNIEKYMKGYLQSDSLRFASGGRMSYGWKTTLERYKSGYADKNAMGHLTFSEIDISIISENSALVFGKWELERASDRPWGLFTLIFQNTKNGWKIIHDHTSSGN